MMRERRLWCVLSATVVVILGVVNGYYFPTPLYPEVPIQVPSLDNELCRNHSEILADSLRNNTLWAYKMWDSSAKDTIGIFDGSTFQLGNFGECLSIDRPIKAQYCLVNIKIKTKQNYTISDPYSVTYNPYESIFEKIQHTHDPNKIQRDMVHLGVCIPASCSAKNAQKSIKEYMEQMYNTEEKHFEISIEDGDCQSRNDVCLFDTKDLLFCLLVVTLFIVVFICTFVDLIYEKRKSENAEKCKSIKLLLCFSARENIADLNKSDSNSSLNVMYGLRFVMMCGIVIGHNLVNAMTGPVLNYEDIERENRSVWAMFICRGEVVVDTFFLFSGLLVTYSFMIQSEKRFVNPIRSILLRYFRLVPLFAIVTFFYATVYYKIGSGPLWNKIIGQETRNCQKNWWTNLLLVNNYVDVGHMCILQAWYIPCDFQLFIMAVPLNMLIKKNFKFGLAILSILLGVSIATPFFITYLGEKDPFYYIFNKYFLTLRDNDVFQTIYIPSHTRAAPYIIGMYFGFLYYRLKNVKFEISMIYTFTIGTIGTIGGLACILGGAVFFNPYRPYDVMAGSIYAALHRPAFALANGITLLCISFGTMTWTKKMLNWQPMIPLGKLTFGAYLTHMAFQLAKAGSAQTPQIITLYTWISSAVLDVTYAVGVSFILFILVENPFIRIMKEILPADTKKEGRISTEELFSTNI